MSLSRDIIYHVGHLAIDRELEGNDALHARATELYDAARRGAVILYQRRCYAGFEYHARFIRGAM